MAFFGKKKSKEKEAIKDLPDFPATFDHDIKFPEFPSFESQSSDMNFDIKESMKHEEPKKMDEFKIPERKTSYESLLEKPLIPKIEVPQLDERPFTRREETRTVFHEEKPLFVKIDDYEDAVYTLDKIKSKLKEADRILEELNKIRNEEEQQLEQWKRDLATVKEKLLMVDKQLFEN